MWVAIQYVTSGVALAAFIALCVYAALRALAARDENLIKTAPKKDRADLVARALEKVHIDATGWSEDKRYDFALEQLVERRRRLRVYMFTPAIVIVLLAAGTLGVFWRRISIVRTGEETPDAREADAREPPDGPLLPDARPPDAARPAADADRSWTWCTVSRDEKGIAHPSASEPRGCEIVLRPGQILSGENYDDYKALHTKCKRFCLR